MWTQQPNARPMTEHIHRTRFALTSDMMMSLTCHLTLSVAGALEVHDH